MSPHKQVYFQTQSTHPCVWKPQVIPIIDFLKKKSINFDLHITLSLYQNIHLSRKTKLCSSIDFVKKLIFNKVQSSQFLKNFFAIYFHL